MNKVSSCDLIDAKLEEHQLCGSKQCPSCGHKLEGKPDWVGLPAGVKFDPTDQELIEHLEAKVDGKESKSHPLIDEFIPTIDGEDGICYTHPEKLPGVTRDGLSRHFFHRPSKAYTTGTRKRRKIQMECDLPSSGGETRWHKTGKTRPVMANGSQKGCKKILVLYTNFGKNRKPEKTNWVMHQYHLGQHEEEKEGELVVSKIFYQTQPRQCNWSDKTVVAQPDAAVSKEIEIIHHRDDLSAAVAAAVKVAAVPAIPTYGAIDHFNFIPFGKTSDEGGDNIGEASNVREVGTCSKQQQHVRHEMGTAYHISRPSQFLHHTPISILNQDHSFQAVPTIILPNHNFEEQRHHKAGGTGLEELIMGCTSSNDIKEESSMTNPQDAEWLKYSNFWPDPDSHE